MRAYSPMNLRGMLSADNIAQELQKVQTYLRQLDGAISQIPGVTGNPFPGPTPPGIVPNPFDDFFYLPGRAGGQLAFGDTNAAGKLTLSSTRNATKGLIYLGSALGSAFVETTSRLGIKTIAPGASLHVKGEAPGSIYWRPASSISGAGFTPVGGVLPTIVNEVVTDDDVTYIETAAANPSQILGLRFNGTPLSAQTFPAATATWVLRFRCRKVGASAVTFNWQINDQSGTLITSGSSVAATTSYNPTFEVPLTLAQAIAIVGIGNTELQFAVNGFGGLGASSATNQWRLTWVELQIPSVGGGKTAIFDVEASQAENNTEWRSSGGTALVDITAGGRLTIESGGSFRHVPGAAASTLFKGDVNGDASWGTVNLLSAYHADTLTGSPVLGDLMVANSTPKWDKLAGNTAAVKKFLNQTGNGTISALPVWSALVAADIPALDNTNLTDRTRKIHLPLALWVQSNGTLMSSTVTGTYPNSYRTWQYVGTPAVGPQSILVTFQVPADWASGTIAIKIMYKLVNVGVGVNSTLEMRMRTLSYGDSNDPAGAATDVSTAFVNPNEYTNAHEQSIGTLSTAAGKHIRLHLDRNKAAGNDDSTDTLILLSAWAEYTADM